MTLKFSDSENKFDFELDMNNNLFKMNNEEYLKKHLKTTKKPEKTEQERRLEQISRIAEMWPLLSEEDRQEVVEIAELMRKGEWVKGSILQWENERGESV